MTIFRDWAPKYWEAALPVIPLKKWNAFGKGAGKAPIINEWQTYGSTMPSLSIQQLWLSNYPENNVGLPLGGASGLFAIHIDPEAQETDDALLGARPPSPEDRVGKKGIVLNYRMGGLEKN